MLHLIGKQFEIVRDALEFRDAVTQSFGKRLIAEFREGIVIQMRRVQQIDALRRGRKTIQAKFSPGGANLRFAGSRDINKASMFTVTGNYLSNQEVNIHLKNCRGVVLSGNSLCLGKHRNILVEGGYLSNPREARLISDPVYRQRLAEAVAGALE